MTATLCHCGDKTYIVECFDFIILFIKANLTGFILSITACFSKYLKQSDQER